MKNKEFSFEESMTSLENIIKKLESGDLSLDEMIKLYEEGLSLSNFCKLKLDAAEQKITTLITEDGELKEVSKL